MKTFSIKILFNILHVKFFTNLTRSRQLFDAKALIWLRSTQSNTRVYYLLQYNVMNA